jgi:hypothetical protein
MAVDRQRLDKHFPAAMNTNAQEVVRGRHADSKVISQVSFFFLIEKVGQ